MSKGSVSPVILIISIIVALLALAVTAGIIIWKVVDSEDSSRRVRDREKDDEKSVNLDPEGYIDCGTSESFLSEFDEIFDIDFEEDEALVCMGKNIKNNCKKSKAFVKTDDFSMDFKISEDKECRILLEAYDDYYDEHYYIDCPIVGIIAYIDSDYPEIGKYVAGSPGTYAATLLVMTINLLDVDYDRAQEFGCKANI